LLGDPNNFSPVLEPYLGGPGRRMFENRMLRNILVYMRGSDNVPGNGENYIMKNFIITTTTHLILVR
jgi:hypothetical protein